MSDLATFLAAENAKMERLYPPSAIAQWNLAITGKPEFAAECEQRNQAILETYSQRAPYEAALAFLAAGVTDPLIERQLQVIKHQYVPNQFATEVVASIAKLETELTNLFTTFRGTFDGAPISDNEAVKILQDSTDSEQRRKAWEATKMVAVEAAPKLRALIKLRNTAAQGLGYPDYYHLMLDVQEIDPAMMFGLWDRLATESDAAWKQLKGELDTRLAARYGIPAQDLRPWHYEDPQFQKAPQDPEANLDTWYSTIDIEGVTTETFAHMGQPIADLVAISSLYPAENKYQSAFCTGIDHQGDIRVCCSIAPNERWMETNLHEFGHAAYEKYVDPTLPWMLRTAAHSITTEGVAVFMGNFAVDAAWMRDRAGIDGSAIAATLPRILRQKQLGDMIFTRYEQVMCRFERELYRDPEQDLNTLWWDLVERYQGLTRPDNRDAPDWASKVHFSIAPCMYQNYLFGYMFITQMAHHLRADLTAGGPLAVPAVGQFLREKVYYPGASLRWDALIAHATGEVLNPDYWVAHITEDHASPVAA